MGREGFYLSVRVHRGYWALRKLDLTGQRFGMLLVVAEAAKAGKHSKWLCRCDCGRAVEMYGDNLKRRQRGCGCLKLKHGHSYIGKVSRTYEVWHAIKQRCHNPSSANYKNYGSRGIRMCEAWRKSFEQFLADMGEAPIGQSIERVDNNGNYSPDNCKWATIREQANNRRTNRIVTYQGVAYTVSQLADDLGIQRGTLLARLNNGWSVERAVGRLDTRRKLWPIPLCCPR